MYNIYNAYIHTCICIYTYNACIDTFFQRIHTCIGHNKSDAKYMMKKQTINFGALPDLNFSPENKSGFASNKKF